MKFLRRFIPFLIAILLLSTFPLTVFASPGWLSGWTYRVKLTIDNTDVDTALSNFPILVYLSTSSGRNGDDISFVFDELENDANRKKIAITQSDGTTELYVEIEKWDDANEQAWLWVKVPNISNTTDTDLYLYYDKDHANNTAYVGDTNSTPAENVWDANYVAVYHMADGASTSVIYDSTGNDRDGTKAGAGEPAVDTNGIIAEAQTFDGANDDISLGDIADFNFAGDSSFTVEAIVKSLNQYGVIVSKYDYGNDKGWILFIFQWGLRLSLNQNEAIVDSTDVLTSGVETYVAGVKDSTNPLTLSINGEPPAAYDTQNNGVNVNSPTGLSTLIGDRQDAPNSTYAFEGNIDEVRISTGVRSAAWLKASYESGTDDLLDFGSEEILPGVPTNFVVTDLGGNTVNITWTKNRSANNTEIRMLRTTYPSSISKGDLVYFGTGNSTTKDGLSLEITTFYFSAWSENSGTYSTNYVTDSTGGESMVFLGILGFAAVMSFIAFRSAFFGLKLMAGMTWFLMYMYVQGNPPAGIVEGSGVHTTLMVISVGFGLMIVLTGLGRGIKSTKNLNGAFEVSSEGFHLDLPKWLKGDEGGEFSPKKREQSTDEYRERMHRALNPPRRKR